MCAPAGRSVTVVDRNETSLAAGAERAKLVGLHSRMDFIIMVTMLCHVRYLLLKSNSPSSSPRFCHQDLLADRQRLIQTATSGCAEVVWLGLHACGGLTDIILDLFCEAGGSFIVCPCCFTKLRGMSCDWFRGRQGVELASISASSLSNSMRAGSDLPPATATSESTASPPQMAISNGASHDENAALDETLCRLAESKRREVSLRAMHLLNSMRLGQLEEVQKRKGCTEVELALLAFPEAYSLRNLVLVGRRAVSSAAGQPRG
eukprot:SAG22_NODE_1826_length_3501_cov_254.010876_2_plen_263_part_00